MKRFKTFLEEMMGNVNNVAANHWAIKGFKNYYDHHHGKWKEVEGASKQNPEIASTLRQIQQAMLSTQNPSSKWGEYAKTLLTVMVKHMPNHPFEQDWNAEDDFDIEDPDSQNPKDDPARFNTKQTNNHQSNGYDPNAATTGIPMATAGQKTSHNDPEISQSMNRIAALEDELKKIKELLQSKLSLSM